MTTMPTYDNLLGVKSIIKLFPFIKWVEEMANAGATQYTFHIEATEDPKRCIRKVREAGMKVRTVKVY